VVIDTSIAVKWFLPEPLSREADAVLEDARLGRIQLAAPDLIIYEFANLLWKLQRRGELGGRDTLSLMRDFELLPVYLVPADVLGSRALAIACQTGCTAYDAAFIALAGELKKPLLTADRKLVKLMDGTRHARRMVLLSADHGEGKSG
jgi:predicted nucleic acid-binding protein